MLNVRTIANIAFAGAMLPLAHTGLDAAQNFIDALQRFPVTNAMMSGVTQVINPAAIAAPTALPGVTNANIRPIQLR